MRLALLAIVALACGCMSQAEKDDIANICFAPERSGANAAKEPSEKAVKMAEFLKTKLETAKWKSFFAKAATMAPAKRTLEIRRAADEAGIRECPILEDG